MAEFAEEELREMYGYSEDITYDEYAESERNRASELLESGSVGEAIAIYTKLTNSIKGDRIACEALGDIFYHGKGTEKDPWKALLYYTSAFSEKGDSMSRVIWESLSGFRGIMLNSRPMGMLKMNSQDVENACCELMKQYMINGDTSMSNIDSDPSECTFSMTMDRKDYKKYLSKQKHEVMDTPKEGTITPMDLTECPFCGAPLVYARERSRDWDNFIDNGF
ncbi:MAG: sel1 repeat family protein [Thermoplasmata archaeon]|nr:sel1 repeat family protein [Thermoplasmata archaeon]